MKLLECREDQLEFEDKAFEDLKNTQSLGTTRTRPLESRKFLSISYLILAFTYIKLIKISMFMSTYTNSCLELIPIVKDLKVLGQIWTG